MDELISIIVPVYNAEKTLRRCVRSLMGQTYRNLEIILVNDGSKDGTAEIAEEYQRSYPGIVRAIHQENGGHGEAVNTGLKNASGLYYKVVDSDDWLDEESLKKVIDVLKGFAKNRKRVDLVICNYVYEHVEDQTSKVIRYTRVLPEDKVFGWNQVGRFRVDQNLLMHSMIYRTRVLREAGLELPKHTFYVDNIYVFEPLPYVRNMYYLDVNFYRYFIGRSDQSVNEKVMTGRIDQQIKVNQIMTDYFVEKKSEIIGNKPLAKYMLSYLDIITTISSILLIRINTPESLEKKRELLNYIRQRDKKVYRKLRYGLLGNCMNLPGKTGRWISVEGYKICQKFFGFN